MKKKVIAPNSFALICYCFFHCSIANKKQRKTYCDQRPPNIYNLQVGRAITMKGKSKERSQFVDVILSLMDTQQNLRKNFIFMIKLTLKLY